MSAGWIGGGAGVAWFPRPSVGGGLAGVLADGGGTAGLTDGGGAVGVSVGGGGTHGVLVSGGTADVVVDGGGAARVPVDGGAGAGLLVGGGDFAGVLTDGNSTAGAAGALGGVAGDGAGMVGRVRVREDSAASLSSAASKSDGSLYERCRSHRSRHECQLRCGCCDDQDPIRAIIHEP